MSELKAYIAPTADGTGLADYYLKSEADKVIAEKDKEIAELQEQVHDYGLGLYAMQARAEKEARHDKYKRCLAMARWCNECHTFNENNEKRTWLHKWHKRWLELAEHFRDRTKMMEAK